MKPKRRPRLLGGQLPTYVDGVIVLARRGRASRLRRELHAIGLRVPRVSRSPRGLFARLGVAPLHPDLAPLADALARFDACLVRVEFTRDYPVARGVDPDDALGSLLARVALRDVSTRWYTPRGWSCAYSGAEHESVVGACYVRDESKIDHDSGPVVHLELRLRGSALRDVGLVDVADLRAFGPSHAAWIFERAFVDLPDVRGTGLARARTRGRALGPMGT